MTPSQVHISLEVLFKAGIPPMRKRGDPGAQGASVTGTQGCGVKIPKAADVAEATWGLAIELHIPKGIILTMGTWSMMLAAGVGTISRFCGRTVRTLGVKPKLHFRVAPIHTQKGIILTSLDYSAQGDGLRHLTPSHIRK